MNDGKSAPPARGILNAVVVVAALGYFVDIYDLILFGIVRRPSLLDLGVPEAELISQGAALFNWQMGGTLVGGLLWGILGDLRGRRATLMGSILLYSVANFANGFVTDMGTYAVLRFVAGVGLAGELGAGITLVAESMDKTRRGWGTVLVAGFGALGAVLAAFIADVFAWRNAYMIGGVLGIALLFLRFVTYESPMFQAVRARGKSRGRFDRILFSPRRLLRFLASIGIGAPISFGIGVVVFFADKFAKSFAATEPVSPGKAIMWSYIGLAVGDVLSGVLSQKLASRRRAVAVCLGFLALAIAGFFVLRGLDATMVYVFAFAIGMGAGYWALFVTMAAEQFGTDLRATVATSAPNFVRGCTIPMLAIVQSSGADLGTTVWVGLAAFVIAAVSLASLSETFGRDLDFDET